jgi:hypothetical protein
MKNRILEFRKTDHFLYRQWDRGIEDKILYKILPYVECTYYEKDVILIQPSFLKRKGLKDEQNSLVIIIKGNFLISAYWCKDPNYLFKKEKNSHFQQLN